MNFLKVIFSKVIVVYDLMLGRSKIIRDLILAIGNLTKSIQDLTKAYVALARLQMEDRDAITELYNLHGDLLSNLPENTPVKAKTTLTPIEQIEQEKKKGSLKN